MCCVVQNIFRIVVWRTVCSTISLRSMRCAKSPDELEGAAGPKGQGRKRTPSPTLIAERSSPSPKPLEQPTVQQQPPKQAMLEQQQPRKKARKMTPEGGVRAAIFQAAKENDPLGGLAVYDRAVAEGAHNSFPTLCHGCCTQRYCGQHPITCLNTTHPVTCTSAAVLNLCQCQCCSKI